MFGGSSIVNVLEDYEEDEHIYVHFPLIIPDYVTFQYNTSTGKSN